MVGYGLWVMGLGFRDADGGQGVLEVEDSRAPLHVHVTTILVFAYAGLMLLAPVPVPACAHLTMTSACQQQQHLNQARICRKL